jgi:hypothetical protein
MTEQKEPWMNNPLMVDQPEGATVEDPPLYIVQTKQPYGGWEEFITPRSDRDEVTRIQAFHLRKDPKDTGLRVWRRDVVWTLDEVPGHGEGQTPPEEILARNEQVTQTLLTGEKDQQPTQ